MTEAADSFITGRLKNRIQAVILNVDFEAAIPARRTRSSAVYRDTAMNRSAWRRTQGNRA